MGKTVTMKDEPISAEEALEESTHEEPVAEEEVDSEEVLNPTRLEDLDPEEELWDGGPKIGQILEWKEEYGDVYVTSLTLDKHIVWRTMDRGEYKQMIRTMEEMAQSGQMSSAEIQLYQEDYIADLAVLYPKLSPTQKDKDLAGMPTIISQEVMDASGFQALEVRQL